jgi:septum formation topological specificity factor MinE
MSITEVLSTLESPELKKELKPYFNHVFGKSDAKETSVEENKIVEIKNEKTTETKNENKLELLKARRGIINNHLQILNDEKKYNIISIICKYINIFHNIHEDEIELSLFTNNIIDII